jgi:hypothetical protein
MQRLKLSIIDMKCGLIPDNSNGIFWQPHMIRTIYSFLEINHALASYMAFFWGL